MWRVVAACARKSMTEPANSLWIAASPALRAVRRRPPRWRAKGAFRRHIGTLVNGLLGAGKQALAASLRPLTFRTLKCPRRRTPTASFLASPPSCSRLRSSRSSPGRSRPSCSPDGAVPGLLRGRDRRLGVVETASVDGHRKLILIRRDTVEHLIMTGGKVDVLIETGIAGQQPLGPPLEDVIIGRAETRPAPDFSKT